MNRPKLTQAPNPPTEEEKAADDRQKGKKPSEGNPSTDFSPEKASGNIQDGTSSPGEFLRDIGFKPQPNRLGELFQYNYHFRFYLDTDIQGAAGTEGVFVIAETGVTGMNIQEVVVDAIVGPNFRTKNANSTNVTIKIYEPFGSQLPDLLFQAAVFMKIKNYLKAPWYLDLRFHGYDENGDIINVDGKWKWKLTLIDVQSNIGEGGTVHTITALPMSEVALNDQHCMLPKAMSVSGDTVGSILQNIQNELNQDIKDRYGDSTPPYIEYVIKDEPYPYDTKVNVSRPFDHKLVWDSPQDSTQAQSRDYATLPGQFPPGQDIPAIIDTLMASSETAVRQARISRELPPGSGPDEEADVRSVVSVMHRVSTKVEYLDYNRIIGDYHKRITYTIRPYDSLRLLTSVGRAQTFDREKDLNRTKASHAVNRALMRKQYDYVFTGLNTEIEKFDISVNFRWAVSVPVLQGKLFAGLPARITDDTMAQQNGLALQQLNDQQRELETKLNQTPEPDPNDQSEEAQAARAARQQLQAEQAQIQTQIDQASTAQGTIINQILAEERARDEQARRTLPSRPFFEGEDAVYLNVRSGGQYAGGLADKENKSYLPITIVQDSNTVSRNNTTGTSTHNSPTKSVYGTLLNQMYGTFDGNLQSIELEIRGDPYWLGKGEDGEEYFEASNDTIPNFMNGEHMFVFRFKLPLGIDEDTGQPAIEKDGPGPRETTSNIFTGFYAVTQVTHKFIEGRFIQTLNAVRIQGWQYENIIEGRDAEFQDPTSDAPIPEGSGPAPRDAPAPDQTNLKLDDTTLLALTLQLEAGGEGSQGMQAVGNVIMNRVRDRRWPGSIQGVILQPLQFSVWNNQSPQDALNKINRLPANHPRRKQFNQAYAIAQKIRAGTLPDITGGANHYHTPAVSPSWKNPRRVTVRNWGHIFYKL